MFIQDWFINIVLETYNQEMPQINPEPVNVPVFGMSVEVNVYASS